MGHIYSGPYSRCSACGNPINIEVDGITCYQYGNTFHFFHSSNKAGGPPRCIEHLYEDKIITLLEIIEKRL